MRARIGSSSPPHAGVLVPWANIAVESELSGWSGNAVAWHYARLVPPSRTTALDCQFTAGLLDAVPSALDQLSALPVQFVYLACTSAAFMNPRRVEAAVRDAQVTLVSAFDAITAVLRQHGAGHVVLMTPYPEEVTTAEADMFDHVGITVTGCASLNLDDGYGGIPPEQVRQLARKVSDAAMEKADAVVLSCTGWHTREVIPDLQRCLGRPVISSNLAMALHARGVIEAR